LAARLVFLGAIFNMLLSVRIWIFHLTLLLVRGSQGMASAVNATFEHLPFGSEVFDSLFAFDVVEHLGGSSLFFREANRVLKPWSFSVISTSNIFSLGLRVKNGSKTLRPAMLSDASHVILLSPDTWLTTLNNASLRVVRHGQILFGTFRFRTESQRVCRR
jgi:hypothetical protein